MNGAGQPPESGDAKPKRIRAGSRKKSFWSRIATDTDLLRSARFLKIVGLGVVTMTAAFCMVGAGAYAIALVIHQIYAALEARKVELPNWVHESEVQSVGAVLLILISLATIIVLKDFWRIGVQGETAGEPEEKSKEG